MAPFCRLPALGTALAAGAGVGRDSGWGSMAAGTALPWCWLSAAYSAPQNSADQKSLHHHYQIPRAGAKCGKLFSAAAFAFQFSVLPPLFQQSFFLFSYFLDYLSFLARSLFT